MFPNLLFAKSVEVPVTLCNITSKYITLKKGHNLGLAVQADSLINDENSHDQEHASYLGTASCLQVKVDQ